jgi:hypothetical protein
LPFYPSGWRWRFEWGKKEWHAVIFVHKTASPFRPGIRPEAEFSGNENSFFYTLLGWVPIVLSVLPFINRPVFRRFHRNSAGDFAKGLKSVVVARRNRLLSCNSETV